MLAGRFPLETSDGATPLGPDDLAACVQLDAEALGGLWSEPQWRQELQDPGRLCLGVRREAELTAMATGWLVVDELQINVVAVAPRYRRRGLGGLVLKALLADAQRLGADRATLEVAACNRAAVALYARCGFTTHGTRRGYYSDGRDALIQWAQLS